MKGDESIVMMMTGELVRDTIMRYTLSESCFDMLVMDRRRASERSKRAGGGEFRAKNKWSDQQVSRKLGSRKTN